MLTGSPITDVRITLTGGRAHAKHTEGGDFRQATYRAIRQGLMQAREGGRGGAAGACTTLSSRCRGVRGPGALGCHAHGCRVRAADDGGRPGEACGSRAGIRGAGLCARWLPTRAVAGDLLYLEFAGYAACHDAERVIEAAAYEPEADLPNTPDSVFCSHGAGYTVKWYDVPAAAHVKIDPTTFRPWRAADAEFFGHR